MQTFVNRENDKIEIHIKIITLQQTVLYSDQMQACSLWELILDLF